MFAIPFAIALAAVASPSVSHATVSRDEAAVIAADESWDAAEARADAPFLNWLLEPSYVSVGADGKVFGRAALIANAAKRHDSPTPERAAEVLAWRAAHPTRTQVVISGSTAVISFVSTKPGSVGIVNSSDVFVYRDGNWHAIYSQHSNIGA